jgi:hypothetical protein
MAGLSVTASDCCQTIEKRPRIHRCGAFFICLQARFVVICRVRPVWRRADHVTVGERERAMPVVQKEVSDRTLFGKICKYTFVLFNIFMLASLILGLANVAELEAPTNEYEEAGAAIGTMIGISFILFFWLAGDVILGLLVLLTRKKKIITLEEAD